MTGLDSWSTTAATNATATGGSINFAEGQTAASLNNSARQLMKDVRDAFNDLIWFQYGTGNQGASNIAVPGVYSSGTAFTIAGVDVTTPFHAGRRLKAVGSTTGTIYGSISSSSFSTDTTVNVTWDSGSLSNETLTIYLSQIPVTGKPITASSIAKLFDTAQTWSALQTNSVGIKVGNAAQSDTATLDFYLEGTFTPAISFGGGTTGITYTTQSGTYVRVGKMVFFSLHVVLSNKGSSTGNVSVTGLPVTASNSSNNMGVTVTQGSNFTGLTGTLNGFVSDAGTSITLSQDSATSSASIDNASFTNTTSFFIAGHYFV